MRVPVKLVRTKTTAPSRDELDELFFGKVCDNIDFAAKDEAVYMLADDFCEYSTSMMYGVITYILANFVFLFCIGLLAWIYSMWYLRKPVFRAILYTFITALLLRFCGGLIDPKMECSYVTNAAGKPRWICDGPLGREWAYMLMQGGFYFATFLGMYIIGIVFLVYVVAFINALTMYMKLAIRVIYALVFAYCLGWVEGYTVYEDYMFNYVKRQTCPLEKQHKSYSYVWVVTFYLILLSLLYLLLVILNYYRHRHIQLGRLLVHDYRHRMVSQLG